MKTLISSRYEPESIGIVTGLMAFIILTAFSVVMYAILSLSYNEHYELNICKSWHVG